MNVIEPRILEMDLESVVRYANVVAEVVGTKWLKRKRQQVRNRSHQKKLEEFGVVYQPPIHPIVDWAIEYDEKWWTELRKTRVPPLSQAVLKLAALGEALELTRSQKGFERLIHRLKQIDSFEAAAFEVEVAASYVSQNYTVEFIEEGTERTPDLRVSVQDNKVFFVECKCREPGTERDKRIESIWTRLETALLSYLRPKRLNYLILIKARTDPDWEDVDYLKEIILNAVEVGGTKSDSGGIVADPRGQFEILVQKLSDSDEIIEANQTGLVTTESLDQGVFGNEWMINEEGKNFIRNPIFLGFKTETPPDWISGVVNLLDAARGQLPEDGPGAIWIRIPDVSWKEGVIEPLERVEELLKGKLNGQQNRRINAVFVMKRIFEQAEIGGHPGLICRPLIIRIDHNNPKTPLQESSFEN